MRFGPSRLRSKWFRARISLVPSLWPWNRNRPCKIAKHSIAGLTLGLDFRHCRRYIAGGCRNHAVSPKSHQENGAYVNGRERSMRAGKFTLAKILSCSTARSVEAASGANPGGCLFCCLEEKGEAHASTRGKNTSAKTTVWRWHV